MEYEIFLKNIYRFYWRSIKKFCYRAKKEFKTEKSKIKQEESVTLFVYITISWGVSFALFFINGNNFQEFFSTTALSVILLFLMKYTRDIVLNSFLICLALIEVIIHFTTYSRQSYEIIHFIILYSSPIFVYIFTRSILLSTMFCLTHISDTLQNLRYLDILCIELVDRQDTESKDIYNIESLFLISSKLRIYIIIVVWMSFRSRKRFISKFDSKVSEFNIIKKTLMKSNEDLVNSLKTKDYVLLSASHEFRNPLNVILGSIELALFDQISQNTMNYLNNIRENADLLVYFINNLLSSDILQKSTQIEKKMVNMWQFTKKIENSLKVLVGKTELYGEMFVSFNMPEILHIDEFYVTQILYNLISNAVKFTPQGFVGVIFSWVNGNEINESMRSPTQEEYFRQYLQEKTITKNENLHDEEAIPNQIPRSFFGMFKGDKNQKRFRTQETLPKSSSLLDNEASPRSKRNRSFYFQDKKIKSMNYYHLFSKYRTSNLNDMNFSIKNSPNKLNFKQQLPNEGFLKIEVIDSGYGINRKDFDEIYNKYKQVDSETHKRLGTGLGLWIVKNLCTQMQGEIKTHSVINQGSVFIALIKCNNIKIY